MNSYAAVLLEGGLTSMNANVLIAAHEAISAGRCPRYSSILSSVFSTHADFIYFVLGIFVYQRWVMRRASQPWADSCSSNIPTAA